MKEEIKRRALAAHVVLAGAVGISSQSSGPCTNLVTRTRNEQKAECLMAMRRALFATTPPKIKIISAINGAELEKRASV